MIYLHTRIFFQYLLQFNIVTDIIKYNSMANRFAILLTLINFSAILLMAFDKWLALKQRFRISERALLLVAFFGGSIGALAGMVLCRHKINKPKFRYLVPFILLLHFFMLGWLYFSGYVKIII